MMKIFKDEKKYSIWLEIDDDTKELIKWNCTCQFGSWWRWAGFWRKKNTVCKHAKKLIKELKRVGLLK